MSKISRTQHCSGLSYALCVHLQNGNCELNCFIFSNLLKLSPFFDWSMYNLVNQICDGSARCICELFRIRRLAAIGNVLVITKKKEKIQKLRTAMQTLVGKNVNERCENIDGLWLPSHSYDHMKLRLYFCMRSSVYWKYKIETIILCKSEISLYENANDNSAYVKSCYAQRNCLIKYLSKRNCTSTVKS